jgi:diguanylate cyclase (GGDEF)-like protein
MSLLGTKAVKAKNGEEIAPGALEAVCGKLSGTGAIDEGARRSLMIDEKLAAKGVTHETRALLACLEVGKLFTSTLSLQEILELIMTKVSQLIEAQNWSLLLKDETSGELTFEIAVGIKREVIKGIRLAPGEGIAGHVAETGKPMFVSNVQDEPRFSRKIDSLTRFTTKSISCIPIQIHGKILGVIEIVNVEDMDGFKLKYLPILTILADYAAIAIENSQLFSRIQRMSITDEYTGLYNARYLHQVLEDLIQKPRGQEPTFAIVFVDIDNFKHVVDTQGHLLGTQALREIGQTFSSCLSEQDILVKYGGDEYVIILPDKNRQQATKLTEKILQTLRASCYLASESDSVKVTASFGIAMYPEDAQMKEDLVSLADKTMFTVKRSTKDGIGIVS